MIAINQNNCNLVFMIKAKEYGICKVRLGEVRSVKFGLVWIGKVR
jgi:hypothetical protein